MRKNLALETTRILLENAKDAFLRSTDGMDMTVEANMADVEFVMTSITNALFAVFMMQSEASDAL